MKRLRYILLFIVVLAFCVVTASADIPKITDRAAIRTEEPFGLRVKAVIDGQTAIDEKTWEYGFLATRKVFLTAKNLTNYDLTFDGDIYYTKGVSKGYYNGEYVDYFFDKNDEEVHFAGYFYGITPYYYTDVIVVRPYIIFQNGTEYGEPIEISLYEASKSIYADKDFYNNLSQAQQDAVYSIILAVDGEPYEINRNDFRIVLSTTVVKNYNPTYSVSYDLFNPFTGEIEMGIVGRKKSKSYDEIKAMLLSSGNVVPVCDGVVQDTSDGYVVCDYSKTEPVWIAECSTQDSFISVSKYDKNLKCRQCISEQVLSSKNALRITGEESVYVFDGSFEGDFVKVSMSDVQEKRKSLLCYNYIDMAVVYADYIKAFASIDDNGNCEYLLVIANGNENAALNETCFEHTRYNVDFYIDGQLYDSRSVVNGNFPTLPEEPEKEGYNFIGWAEYEGGMVMNPQQFAVTDNIKYFAVFEKIPVYFQVSFTVDGEEYDRQTVLCGECPTLPEPPKKEGYDFIGWSEIDGGETVLPDDIAVSEDMQYHAVFKIREYTVTFYVKDSIQYEILLAHGQNPTPPKSPEISGNVFLGWALTESGTKGDLIAVSELVVTDNLKLYAVFEVKENDPNLIGILTRGRNQLKKLRITADTKNDKARDLIVECIGYVLEDANNGIYIDTEYIYNTYNDLARQIKVIIKDEMTKEERSGFVSLLTNEKNIDKDVQDFLIEYFDIDVSAI